MTSDTLAHLQLYRDLGLTPIPLKSRSKVPLVKWRDGWNPTLDALGPWLAKPGINWANRCGPDLAGLDFDSLDDLHAFLQAHPQASSWPRVRTGRGFHLWVKPYRPMRSQRVNGIEVKCIGSYIVAPPSTHPSGTRYTFEVAPNGALPEVDLEALLGLPTGDALLRSDGQVSEPAPLSDFALRYGKSQYPEALCGLATMVLSRSDGRMKKLLSLRCWKWHCPKCTPLLKRYWQERLEKLPFRFILRLPTMTKPTKFLRSLGKPRYVHIVANGESHLLLLDGDECIVWELAQKHGYTLVAGDASGDPGPEDIDECLKQALCREVEPLNIRRKITHARGLLKRVPSSHEDNESKCDGDCSERGEDLNATSQSEPRKWDSEVVW